MGKGPGSGLGIVLAILMAVGCAPPRQTVDSVARVVLEAGLVRDQSLLERSLNQTPATLAGFEHSETVSAGAHRGHLIEKSEDGTLLREPMRYYRWVFVSAKGL